MAPRRSSAVRFRRSEHLVAYWDHGGLRIRNFATGRTSRASSNVCDFLGIYSTWRTTREATALQRRYDLDRVEIITARMHQAGLLLRSDEEVPVAETSMAKLAPWNPAVGFFLSSTRDVRFARLADMRQRQRVKAATHPWPGAVYVPPGTMRRLPAAEPSALSDAFVRRRTWRRFAPGPVGLQMVASLLWITGGVQRWMTTDLGEFALKTSPSGGALHPVELYLLSRRVTGLRAGFYHYDGSAHCLRQLTRHSQPAPLLDFLPRQPWFDRAAAVVFFVAHYERSLWRYTYARAYRAPFIEAGHMAQTFCVRATELGLAPFVTMALADTPIEREIGADGVTRAVLYAAGVGRRPPETDWAPLPDAMGDLEVRDNVPTVRRIRRNGAVREAKGAKSRG